MKQHRFYIIGCQRSGTTLLRLILGAHSQIYCYDEINAYDILKSSQPELLYSFNTEVRWIGFKIPRLTEQFLEARWVDYDLSYSFPSPYQNEPLLFIVRDVRDVIVSMMRLKMNQDESWLEACGIPVLERWIKHVPHIQQRYADDLKFIYEKSQFRNIAFAALYWKIKNESLFEYRQAGLPVLHFSYFELVEHTKDVIERIITHIGAEWHEALLKHYSVKHNEADEQGITVGATDTTKPISSTSVGQYEQHFSADELEEIEMIAGSTMQKLKSIGCFFSNNEPNNLVT